MRIEENKYYYLIPLKYNTFEDGGLAGLIKALQELQSKVGESASFELNIEYGDYDSVDEVSIEVMKPRK